MGVPSVENERILLLDLFVEYSEVASLKAGRDSIVGIRNRHVQEHQIIITSTWIGAVWMGGFRTLICGPSVSDLVSSDRSVCVDAAATSKARIDGQTE